MTAGGDPQKQDTNKTRNALRARASLAKLLLELVELTGIEPVTS